jgi:enoyl-CoA hydratase/carnithine racemase
MAEEYGSLSIKLHDQVSTITIANSANKPIESANLHWELARALSDIRTDNGVRIVVITGEGDQFLGVRPPDSYRSEVGRKTRTQPQYLWETFTGTAMMHEQMAQMEKPIIARVNGDAFGFGSTLVFACDLIVAREDARFADTHMAMGEFANLGHADFGTVPGDGGTALMPLFMTPALAKEYLMLSRPFTATELVRLGIINYSVPADRLDSTVDDLVVRLLKRSAYALAWTKRAANRMVAEQLTKALDAGLGYEMVTFLQWEQMGWRDTKSLGGKPTEGKLEPGG